MKNILTRHKKYWKNKTFLFSSIIGSLFFLLSLVANKAASIYATERASNSVKDLILNNIPVFNVSLIVNEGALIFLFFVLGLLVIDPKRIPFASKAAAFFILIRSIFIILTHLGPFPEQSFIDQSSLMSSFNLGSDLFFSGHTGLPLLIALIFWDNRIARYISLGASFIFGASVLLGHLHYSIDVFSAFFITYTIFHLSLKLFAKDYKLFNEID